MLSSAAVDRPLVPCCAVAAALAALAALAAGCGFSSPSSSPDGQPPSPDAPSDGGSDGPPAGPCLARWYDGTVALAAPTLVAGLGSLAVDRDPFLTPDELTIYFSTERNVVTSGDVYTATRTSLTAPFSVPLRDGDLSSMGYDSRFTMTANQLIGVVASSRTGGEGDNDLWISTRANTSDKFANFDRSTMGLSNINSNASELDPEISADGLRIYLAIDNPQRIVVAERSNLGSTFGNSKQIAELFSNKSDADPSLSPDERIIVFASARDNGNTDLFYATRADKNATFSTPVRLAISSINGDGDPFLSSDGCRLYFASDRSGNWELYVASVTPQQ